VVAPLFARDAIRPGLARFNRRAALAEKRLEHALEAV
jgi:hypothetical protein